MYTIQSVSIEVASRSSANLKTITTYSSPVRKVAAFCILPILRRLLTKICDRVHANAVCVGVLQRGHVKSSTSRKLPKQFTPSIPRYRSYNLANQTMAKGIARKGMNFLHEDFGPDSSSLSSHSSTVSLPSRLLTSQHCCYLLTSKQHQESHRAKLIKKIPRP